MQIIDGKKIASDIDQETTRDLASLLVTPRLAIVLINPDERSKQYVKLKQAKASELGINVELNDWSGKDLAFCKSKMTELSKQDSINGIIVQLPAPGLDNLQDLLDIIPAHKDVDGLGNTSLEAIKNDQNSLIPATPRAIIEVLSRSVENLITKKILIVGQGKLVGKPLAMILTNKGYQLTTADSNTADLTDLCKDSDVIVSAVGKIGRAHV